MTDTLAVMTLTQKLSFAIHEGGGPRDEHIILYYTV